ncbi:MAG: NINE protein [Lachnospiraceae bacterium]|nr:NINE protein [Lachnospiraceae bacterium]
MRTGRFIMKSKSKTTALILSILLGGLGVDRFYLGYTGMGILKLLTVGCFGILSLIDIINIATGKLRPADGSPYEEDLAGNPYAAQQAVGTAYDELEKVAKLHEQGVLSDEEFEKLKADLMEKM